MGSHWIRSLVLVVALAPGMASAQAILPNARTQFVDANGAPLAGGSVYFYIPGTTTPATTWQDPALSTPNTNPVVLDSGGRAQIWGNRIYREVVYDQFTNIVWDQQTSSGFTLASLDGATLTNITLAGTTTFPSGASVVGTGVIPNSVLVNSGVTLGTTTVALGATATELDGLTKLVGAGAVSSGITAASFGFGYQASPSYSATQIYNMSVCTAFPCGSPPFANYDALQGAAYAPSGTTVTNTTGIAGYVFNQAAGGSAGNAVAVFGIGASAANGAFTWGVNTLVTDSTAQSPSAYTGNILQGYESDFNVTSPNTEVFGITIEGASIVQPAVANGYSVGIIGPGLVWTTGFISANGCCSNALSIGNVLVNGTGSGQPVLLDNDYNGIPNNSLVLQAAGGILNLITPTVAAVPQNITAGSSNLSLYVADPSGGKGHQLNVSVQANSSCGGARCLVVSNE